MSWISYTPFKDATGRLKASYEKYKRPNNTIANIFSVHSLRPHTLEGHVAFYRSVIGHSGNTLPLWFLEAIGVYVSVLNNCAYCIDHHIHFGGVAYPESADQWDDIAQSLKDVTPSAAFHGKQLAFMDYAEKLTSAPSSITEEDIAALREAGADDGAILEVNQVAGYFAYANRTVLGLGVSLAGETHEAS
ncbi:peroxidase-related enzyme [Pseudovibrio sp. Tun.PSC04-5.I4]|uniref:carboxymuconolactone decarboxylase family protein n=1 Tax=Pseudovibrio sp. Tun.PSC04-5.I4 TaxID=1798213 RepID=UPI0008834C39|nr:peroxidase-related enzyme [Pseudovibrio sp. Tun.PSC04-5.I4]SDQ72883.1 uncharacterized peroxidase-related enzyme [Pseudovibrio sp. Tun.PSC04-5.I4]